MQAIRPSDRAVIVGTNHKNDGNPRGGDPNHDTDESMNRKRRRPLPPNILSRRVSPPTSIEIRGVPIHFPFAPYPCGQGKQRRGRRD